MKPLDRNISILEHVVSYCRQIEQTVERFGDEFSIFQNDPIYRNAAALCILQIGELVGKLTEEFREQHPAVPWRQIKAMRNIVAHSYGTVDPEITWEIISEDIPALKKYCETIIASQT
nr:HepT-like ribonuclease domain-containing protein [uncultured Oscillibacter sp.]